MAHRYFFHNPVKGFDVPSSEPVLLEQEQVVDWVYDSIGDEPGSFFGVISPDDTTLQFYLLDYDDRVQMEIPDPGKQGSYATVVDFDKALDVISKLPDRFSIADFEDLEFESWSGGNSA